MTNYKNSGIYMILNTINQKVYVGSSSNVYKRKARHFSRLRKNKHFNKHLQRAWNKYGEDKFMFITIQLNIPKDNLYSRESYWIKFKNSINRSHGYNKTIPIGIPNLTISEELREEKRRIAYKQHYGETSEKEYQKWRNNNLNPKLLTREEKIHNATVRCGKPLYGICQHTNKIKEKFNSVQELLNKYHKGANKYIDEPNKFVSRMAIVSVANYKKDKDYRKVYKKYTKKGKFKGKPIETFNPITLETIRVYNNQKELAKDLGSTVKYIGRVRRGTKGQGLYKGVGIRWKT